MVEPQASTRGLLQFGLVRAGFQVTSVRTAEEAERVLADGPAPSLVVSEIRLPGLDGVTFCARLRRSAMAEVPVLLLTAQPSEAALARALSAGAHDVLAKPLFVGDLVSLARLESSRAPGSPTLVASTREVPVSAALRALLAGTRSGRLVLGASAELLFRSGQVLSARVRGIQGERAFRRMLFLGEGAYAVHLGPVRSGSGELGVDLRSLCGPWADGLAAWRSLTRVSIPLEAVLCPDLRALLAQISQLPEEVEPVVRLFDGERTVRAVVLESSLPESVVLQVTNRLYASGALLPARVARARGLEPMPTRVRTGWDEPSPRVSTPPVPWSTGQTPGPNPALALTVAEGAVPAGGGTDGATVPATVPGMSPPQLPGVRGWESTAGVGEMERALRSVPLGLEPLPPPVPRLSTPSAVPAASRTPPAPVLAAPPIHRPPTPPSVPVALEAGEESPLAVAARQVALAQRAASPGWSRKMFLGGLAVLASGFVGTAAWVRSVAPQRPGARSAVLPAGRVIETELDRLLTRASERIDAHDDRGAEEVAMRAAAVDPSEPRAFLLLARIHLRTGRPERARSELARVLELQASGREADQARVLLSTLP